MDTQPYSHRYYRYTLNHEDTESIRRLLSTSTCANAHHIYQLGKWQVPQVAPTCGDYTWDD